MKKVIIAVPLFTLALLAVLIISVNIGNSDSPVAEEETVESKETESLEMSKHNPANPKSYSQQIENSAFGEPKDFVVAIHTKWHEMKTDEQYLISPDSESFRLISSVVPEINYLRSNIDSGMTDQFNALQETAHKVTSPVIEMDQEERKALIPIFETQLNEIYAEMMNRY